MTLKNKSEQFTNYYNICCLKTVFTKPIFVTLAALISTFAITPLAYGQTSTPANPTGVCTYNWNVWSSGGPDDNPGGGNRRLDPSLRVFNLAGSWYTTTIAPGSSQSPLEDNVAPTQLTGTNSEWERMYGVGYFLMEPGTVQTININDSGTFDGHVFAIFDSAGNQVSRFPQLSDGEYIGSSNNASHVGPTGVLEGASWSDSFTFTVPADGQVFFHYIWADEDNIGRFATTDACRSADLVTEKSLASGSSATPAIGDTVTFEISVTNNGAVDATNVTLTDQLPAGLTAASGNGVTTAGTYDAATGIWTIPTLTNGDTQTLTLEGTVDAGQEGQTITNTTTPAVSDQYDPSTAGDDLTEAVIVDSPASPSLSMTKVADSPGPFTVGDVVTYTYTVTNDGDTIIRDVGINDAHNGSDPAPIPGSETLLTDNGTIGDSNDATADGSWDVLAPGDVVTFTGTYIVTTADAANL